MKRLLLVVLAHALAHNIYAQVVYSTNLSTGLGATYKSNFLPKYGGDINYEFNNGLLLGFGIHFGNNSFGLASRTPDIVEKNRTLQAHIGFVQHTSKKFSIQTYIGISRIKTVSTSSQEDAAFYLTWLTKQALTNSNDVYEPSYVTTTFKDYGIPIGVNFVFREKKIGWHFGYYAVVAKHYEIGAKLGLTLGSRKKQEKLP